MAEFSMWGGGGGISDAIADQGRIAQTGLVNAQTAMQQAELQDLPQKRQQIQAQTLMNMAHAGLYAAEAGLKREALEEQKAFIKALQDAEQPDAEGSSSSRRYATPEDEEDDRIRQKLTGGKKAATPSDFIMNLARKAAPVAPNKAIELAKVASSQLGHEAAVERNKIDADKARIDAEFKMTDWLSRRIGEATSPEGLKKVNMEFAQTFGKPSPLWDAQWSPDLVEKVQGHALSVKDKIQLQRQEMDRQDRERQRQQQNAIARDGRNIQRQILDFRKEQAERDKKNGGKPLARPNKDEVSDFESIIKEEMPDVYKAGDPAIRAFAEDGAFISKQKRDENPGLTPRQADMAAFRELKRKLEVAGGVLGIGKKLQYKSNKPGSQDSPYPAFVPKDQREDEKWYTAPNGQIVKWDKAKQVWTD